MRRKVLAVAVGALLVSSACSGGDDDGDPTTTSRKEPTTTVDEIDPSVIPDEITPEYVEAVLTELYDVQRRALQLTLDENFLTDETIELVNAIYSPDRATPLVNELGEGVSNNYENFKRPAGATEASAIKVLTATDDCVFFTATLDYNAVVVEPFTSDSLLALRPATTKQQSAGNSTAWQIVLNRTDAGTSPEDPCAA